MKLEIGKCLKCGATIMENRRPSSNWTQRGYLTENGDCLFVALCKNCELTPSEYAEAGKLLGYNLKDIAKNRDGKEIVDTYIDILRDAQDGKCFYCGKDLKENYAVSGGHISCEMC